MSQSPPVAAGKLYCVGTPIGNLGDITLRAVEILRSAPVIVAEDTRHTRGLLSHLQIGGKELVAVEAHSTEARLASVVTRLVEGQDVALVTDAGMPAVSDPGARLVAAAAAAGVEVLAIPGPSALTSAVAVSGLVEGPFWFIGFLPRGGGARRELLRRIAGTADAVVLFEAPGRVENTLGELCELHPERTVSVSRELTKVHEETVRGPLAELAKRTEWRGEVVIVLGPWSVVTSEQPGDSELEERILELVGQGWSTKSVVAELSVWSGRPRRELYAAVEEARGHREREARSPDE